MRFFHNSTPHKKNDALGPVEHVAGRHANDFAKIIQNREERQGFFCAKQAEPRGKVTDDKREGIEMLRLLCRMPVLMCMAHFKMSIT
jgi:hypothetical protein